MPEHAPNVVMGQRLQAKQIKLQGIPIGTTRKDVTVPLTKAPDPEILPGVDGVIGIAALKPWPPPTCFSPESLGEPSPARRSARSALRSRRRVRLAAGADKPAVRNHRRRFLQRSSRRGRRVHIEGIIHDWNDDAALKILKNCRHAIHPDGTPLLVEGVLTQSTDPTTALMDMLMVLTSGR
jgi:hypothetical protein